MSGGAGTILRCITRRMVGRRSPCRRLWRWTRQRRRKGRHPLRSTGQCEPWRRLVGVGTVLASTSVLLAHRPRLSMGILATVRTLCGLHSFWRYLGALRPSGWAFFYHLAQPRRSSARIYQPVLL